MTFSVLHLLKELVSWILVTILLHLGQVALLWGDGSIHLEGAVREGVIKKGHYFNKNMFSELTDLEPSSHPK